jgi:hypothetical protein
MNHIVHMQVLYSLAKLECIVPYILFTDVLFPIFVIFNYLNSKVQKRKRNLPGTNHLNPHTPLRYSNSQLP